MAIDYTVMSAQQLTAEAAPVIGQLKGSKNALGRYLHATLVHANKYSDGNVVANLYRLLKADDINSGHLRAVRHATFDCTGFVLKASNPKSGELKISCKRDHTLWLPIKDQADIKMAQLIGPSLDGAGISTFVNRPKVKKDTNSANDDDGTGNGEVKNAYEAIVGGIAAVMSEINAIAPNDAEVMADLQVLLAMETKLKTKLLELKSRLGGQLVANG